MGEINLRLSCYLNEVFFMNQSRMPFSDYLLCKSIKNQNLINSLKQHGWSVSKESDHYVFIKE